MAIDGCFRSGTGRFTLACNGVKLAFCPCKSTSGSSSFSCVCQYLHVTGKLASPPRLILQDPSLLVQHFADLFHIGEGKDKTLESCLEYLIQTQPAPVKFEPVSSITHSEEERNNLRKRTKEGWLTIENYWLAVLTVLRCKLAFLLCFFSVYFSTPLLSCGQGCLELANDFFPCVILAFSSKLNLSASGYSA